jgi:hypothetical protein
VIWDACNGLQHVTHISGRLYRLVESQEQVATMGYVDTLEEQQVLEELLEAAKPTYPDAIANYHYLLTTPFRYPPLKYGSRFGRVDEPSLFYAGCSIPVTLAEAAFYRFVFIDSIDGVTDNEKIRTEHTLFSVDYETDNGIRLQNPPFDSYKAALTHKHDYLSSQQLGTSMRQASVVGFEYESARDLNQGICVALYDTSAFKQVKPTQTTQWLCEVSLKGVLFKSVDENTLYQFSIEEFLLDGLLPSPA